MDCAIKTAFFSGNSNLIIIIREQRNREHLTSKGSVLFGYFPMPAPKEIGQEHCPGKFHTSMPKHKENEINGI